MNIYAATIRSLYHSSRSDLETTPSIHGADFIENEPTIEGCTPQMVAETVTENNDDENIQEGFLGTASFALTPIHPKSIQKLIQLLCNSDSAFLWTTGKLKPILFYSFIYC
ncbi:hypothetical protein AYI70_g9019 [Smittium culicis]|uniref:Uncharacterized protein n=1 Tax=Smittium culicis TaxID=133412 RepID=A0A1R1XD72_9FUNG|nr:hypothetical protein AYI70_g9019 [Smittium culicis]